MTVDSRRFSYSQALVETRAFSMRRIRQMQNDKTLPPDLSWRGQLIEALATLAIQQLRQNHAAQRNPEAGVSSKNELSTNNPVAVNLKMSRRI